MPLGKFIPDGPPFTAAAPRQARKKVTFYEDFFTFRFRKSEGNRPPGGRIGRSRGGRALSRGAKEDPLEAGKPLSLGQKRGAQLLFFRLGVLLEPPHIDRQLLLERFRFFDIPGLACLGYFAF